MFQAHYVHSFLNGTALVLNALALEQESQSNTSYRYLGQKRSEKHYGDLEVGAAIHKLCQRADVRQARGCDYKKDPIHHSFIHPYISSPNMYYLLVICQEQGA